MDLIFKKRILREFLEKKIKKKKDGWGSDPPMKDRI